MYKQDYSKYLNNNNSNKKKGPKDYLKLTWVWVKLILFVFIIVSMLWGCVQMYQPEYTVNTVTDMAGNKIYSPGVSFEIIIKSLGDWSSKTHWFQINNNGELVEYAFNPISNWGQAFYVTSSPFYGFFVYPLAWILVAFISLFSTHGANGLDPQSSTYGVSALFAILITSILIRGITLAFTWKTQLNQEKMQGLQAKQAEIQEKYKNSSDPSAKQKQQMELMSLYKKEGISPMSSIATSFLSMPFLFAMFSVVRATHALKVATIGEITLVEVPFEQIKQGNWIYLTLIVVYLPLQIGSMMLPMILQMFKKKPKLESEQQKKAKRKQLIMQIVFMVVFLFVVFNIASGVAIYWIFSSTFQIIQTLSFHFLKETRPARIKKKREKQILKNKTLAAKVSNEAKNKK
ncbi:membrane protein insertase YidC [Spiroplasma diminutum]|uniref:Inner membrane protein translocase component YidC n=1 Tax=Spiroplasma diminutum CUAS-1 TaxID=1276221 RepID=S5MKQ9_9MOLU|nr:membrane protein insertase YidC [Spiroplasma diminutum]AGR42560.1 inner membrane protein translocase component YidC [Spiroplasma diminutum CUAS-1]